MASINSDFKQLKDIILNKKALKPPSYVWQELALTVIKQLNVPASKRNSVFKVCKLHSVKTIQQALIDTKELCRRGEKWKYFFKIVNN